MIFEILFLFLFIAILMQKPLYRFCAQQLTRGISGSMSSGATTVLAAATATTTSSSPKNILNNSSSASIAEATNQHQSKQLSTSVNENVVRAQEADDTAVIDKKMSMVEVVNSNGGTHVNSDNNNRNINNNNNTMNGTTTNGHNTQNGDIASIGADTVDKAAAAMHLTNDKSELFKLNEGGDGNNKTTTTTTNSNIKSKEAEITSNGINANGTSLLNVPATDDACDLSRSDSRTSCDSMPNNNNNNDDSGGNNNNPLEGTNTEEITSISTTSTATLVNSDTLKKKLRLSSGRQITKKAKRVRFFRNGDKFYSGLVIPVSNERYRSFESLTEDLTRVLGESIKVPGAVRTIFTVDGKKVSTLEDLEDGKCYVCSCNNEVFKRIEYSSQQNNKLNNRLSR